MTISCDYDISLNQYWWHWKVYSHNYNFVVLENIPILTFNRLKLSISINMKICFEIWKSVSGSSIDRSVGVFKYKFLRASFER
jgi:hypothetical protein